MAIKRIIIVDDEPLSLASLRMALSQFGGLEIVTECANGYEAVRSVLDLKPDLVFLDIQMPGLTGFDVIDLLGEQAPPVVFVTAYDEYALRAFEAHAVDYILKPIQNDRLHQALEHAEKFSDSPVTGVVAAYQDLNIPLQRLIIRDGKEILIIPVEKIIYLEAQDDYVQVHTEKNSHLKYERLTRLENLLDTQSFIRVHRSFIININYLKKLEPFSKSSYLAYMSKDAVVPVSRSGYKRLQKIL